MGKIVLGSQSPFRKQLMQESGLSFITHSPGIKESELKTKNLSPMELSQSLAKLKCLWVAKKYSPGDFIIGADQVASLENEILNKPQELQKAVDQLMKLSGKTHKLFTSLCVSHQNELFEHTEIAELTMKPLTQKEALDYVKGDRSWDCAGSYKIEKNGRQLFETVKSFDDSSIVGLPMETLKTWLFNKGFIDL